MHTNKSFKLKDLSYCKPVETKNFSLQQPWAVWCRFYAVKVLNLKGLEALKANDYFCTCFLASV